jgi:hypothetical protein
MHRCNDGPSMRTPPPCRPIFFVIEPDSPRGATPPVHTARRPLSRREITRQAPRRVDAPSRARPRPRMASPSWTSSSGTATSTISLPGAPPRCLHRSARQSLARNEVVVLEDLINFGRHGEARTTNRRDRRKDLRTRERRDQGSRRHQEKQSLGRPDQLRSAWRSTYDKPARPAEEPLDARATRSGLKSHQEKATSWKA